jgi:hypothetical protein
MKVKIPVIVISFIVTLCTNSFSQPIVLNGAMLRDMCSTPITSLRLCTSDRIPVPFQIDELTENGNYICDKGNEPNADSSNGIFDSRDEIVFLFEDCGTSDTLPGTNAPGIFYHRITVGDSEKRFVFITNDTSLPLSTKQYIAYDHKRQFVKTPYYFAQFSPDRFHFTSAGIWDSDKKDYEILTRELRVTILLKALWGLIPIRYTEDNLVCIVKNYKAGAIRLIRGGDFHLRLGLGIKGSRAYVHQLCYPQVVKVPVNVHVPVKFSTFFKDAYIEMSPVIVRNAGYVFNAPAVPLSDSITSVAVCDTVVRSNPNNKFYSVTNGSKGYGWILDAKIKDDYLKGSGYLIRKPSPRDSASVEYGFRMTVVDLPKGHYEINNWVSFPSRTYTSINDLSSFILRPHTICTPWITSKNLLLSNPLIQNTPSRKH